MIVVGHNKAEVNVLGVVDDLHCGGLIVRASPGSASVLFEQHIGAVGAGSFGNRELGVGENGHAGPLRQVAVKRHGTGSRNHGVELLAGFDVVLLLECNQGRLTWALAEDDCVGAQATPTALTWGCLVAVVNGHAEAELNAAFELGEAKGGLRELDFVDGLLGGGIAGDLRFGSARAGLVLYDHVANRTFHATERVVIQSDLLGTIATGDHQLDGITVPRAVCRVFVIVIGHDEAEIDVFGVVHDLHCGCLVIRAGPGTAGILLEQYVLTLGTRSFGNGEFRVGQDGDASPFTKVTVENNGFGGKHH